MSRSSLSRTHALLAGLALFLGMLATVSGAALADEPTLALSKDSGPPTTRIVASGTGFGSTETVDVSYGGVVVAEVDTDANGAFSGARFRVPGDSKPGNHTISARGRASDIVATARFLVQADWPQYRGAPAHLGFNRYENVLSPSTVDRLDLAWRFDAREEVNASPTVVGGVLYSGSQRGELFALDAANGDRLWRADAGSGSSPAVAGGVAYVSGAAVAAYDAATGEGSWSVEFPFAGPPTLLDDVVYVAGEGIAAAYDAATGDLRWDRPIRGDAVGGAAVAGGRMVVGTTDGRVYSIDASSGRVRWMFRGPGYILSSPAVTGGVVVTAVGEGRLYAFDASNGHPLWHRAEAGAGTAPAVVDGVAYVGTGYGTVEAYAIRTGRLLWRFHAGGGDVESAPVVAKGVVYVGSNGDMIYALDADSGEELWSYRTGDGIQSSPTVVNGMVYVGCKDGRIYAFGLG